MIDEDSTNGLAKNKDFSFGFTPSTADCPVELEFKYSVNGTEAVIDEFASIIYTHGSGVDPILRIETQDPMYTGLHDIQIWIQVKDSDTLSSSKDWTVMDNGVGPITIDFQVKMYNSYCLYGVIAPVAVTDMAFEIASPSIATE